MQMTPWQSHSSASTIQGCAVGKRGPRGSAGEGGEATGVRKLGVLGSKRVSQLTPDLLLRARTAGTGAARGARERMLRLVMLQIGSDLSGRSQVVVLEHWLVYLV